MPRPKKVVETPVVEEKKAPGPIVEAPKPVEPAPSGPVYPPHVAESRKQLLIPLQPGQAYFEAPDGFIIIGEADRPWALYRQGNDGKGMRINQRR